MLSLLDPQQFVEVDRQPFLPQQIESLKLVNGVTSVIIAQMKAEESVFRRMCISLNESERKRKVLLDNSGTDRERIEYYSGYSGRLWQWYGQLTGCPAWKQVATLAAVYMTSSAFIERVFSVFASMSSSVTKAVALEDRQRAHLMVV